MPDRHEPLPPDGRPVRSPDGSRRAAPASPPGRDPVSLFAEPIGRATSLPDDPVPVTQTLYRTPDGRYVIRTCLQLGAERDACDVMIYPGEAELREALSAGGDGLDRALLSAAGLDPAGP